MTDRRPDRPPAPIAVAGWRIALSGELVYLTEIERTRDPGMPPEVARALAAALQAAADHAKRQHQRRRRADP